LEERGYILEEMFGKQRKKQKG